MKKIFFLMSCLTFLLCGCSANYDLSIQNGKIIENFEVLGDNNRTNNTYVENNLLSPTPAKKSQLFDTYTNEKVDGVAYYEVSKIEKDYSIGLNYKYEFDFSNFQESNAMNKCYEYFNVMNNDGILIISTSKENKCISMGLDRININIETRYKVLDNNADSVYGNTYSWSIREDNYENKNIYIKLDTRKKADKTDEEKELEEKTLKIFITIGIILIVLIVIIAFVLAEKRRKLEND